MPNITDFHATGKILEVRDSTVVFQPEATTYQLHLELAEGAAPQAGPRPVEATIRAKARKIWTVPSGGNFVVPIFGPPRIIQGRVKWLSEGILVVKAGTDFVIEMPPSDHALDLPNGAIDIGSMVHVTIYSGASISLTAPVSSAP